MTVAVITSKSNFETSSKLSIDNGRTDGSLKLEGNHWLKYFHVKLGDKWPEPNCWCPHKSPNPWAISGSFQN